MRDKGVRVVTVREILAFGTADHVGARVELEEFAMQVGPRLLLLLLLLGAAVFCCCALVGGAFPCLCKLQGTRYHYFPPA